MNLSGRATIKHVNLRKEGPSEDQVLAVDVKLVCTTSADILAYFHPTLRALLFNDAGSPRIKQLDPIGLSGEVKHMDLDLAGIKLTRAEIKKFLFEPIDGHRVVFTFNASFEPARAQLIGIADLLGMEVAIDIRPEAELDLGGPGRQQFKAEPRPQAKPVTVEINMDKRCAACKKPGATQSGLCLKCAADKILGKIKRAARKPAARSKKK